MVIRTQRLYSQGLPISCMQGDGNGLSPISSPHSLLFYMGSPLCVTSPTLFFIVDFYIYDKKAKEKSPICIGDFGKKNSKTKNFLVKQKWRLGKIRDG